MEEFIGDLEIRELTVQDMLFSARANDGGVSWVDELVWLNNLVVGGVFRYPASAFTRICKRVTELINIQLAGDEIDIIKMLEDALNEDVD